MSGSADELDAGDIAEILHASDLSAENRRYVHNALVSSMLEGWTPSRESVALLIDAVTGNITAAEYRARVVASVGTRGRQLGQFPNISVPDDFDDPLPDAEILAGKANRTTSVPLPPNLGHSH
jgi:Antitoxin VbhA